MLTPEIQRITGPIFDRLQQDHRSELDAYKARISDGRELAVEEMQARFPHVFDYWKARLRAQAKAKSKPVSGAATAPKPVRVYTDEAEAVAAAQNEIIGLFSAMYGEQAGNRLRRAHEEKKMAQANPEAFYSKPQTAPHHSPPPARTESPVVIAARRRAGLHVDQPQENESPVVAQARLRAANSETPDGSNPLIAEAKRRAAKEAQRHDR